MEIFPVHLHSQTVSARELKFLENVHPPPCFTCHVSFVRCQVSGVSCQVTHLFKKKKKLGQSGEASWWKVCYQRYQPCLVFSVLKKNRVPDMGEKCFFVFKCPRFSFQLFKIISPPCLEFCCFFPDHYK